MFINRVIDEIPSETPKKQVLEALISADSNHERLAQFQQALKPAIKSTLMGWFGDGKTTLDNLNSGKYKSLKDQLTSTITQVQASRKIVSQVKIIGAADSTRDLRSSTKALAAPAVISGMIPAKPSSEGVISPEPSLPSSPRVAQAETKKQH